MQRKNLTCSAESFHRMALAVNKRTDEVRMRRKHLDDVIACHKRHGGSMTLYRGLSDPDELNRRSLFELMTDHGEICGKGAPDNWTPARILRDERQRQRGDRESDKRLAKLANKKPGLERKRPSGGLKRKVVKHAR